MLRRRCWIRLILDTWKQLANPHKNPPRSLVYSSMLQIKAEKLLRFCMGGFLVALTSFLTTYATSKKQALQHGYHIDASQELHVIGPCYVFGVFSF